MNKKVIPSKILDILIDRAIEKEAQEENIEIGRALKEISGADLNKILGEKSKKRTFNKILWERIAWSVSVAALIAIAITVPIGIENSSKNDICNLVYAYNEPELSKILSSTSRSSGEPIPDITKMSDEELKDNLPLLQQNFESSASLQDYAINGKVLALSYIRLHKRKEAKETLNAMIEKLSVDEDYESVVQECKLLLNQIK